MKKIILFFLSSSLFWGCSQNDGLGDLNIQDNPSSSPVRTAEQKAILKYIGRKSPKSRSSEDVRLIPYTVDGDTVMYLANYDEGWELFSNDLRVPMVLMRSGEGSLYPEFIDNPSFKAYFENTAAFLAELKKNSSIAADSIDADWSSYVSLMSNEDQEPDPETPVYEYRCVYTDGTSGISTYTPLGGRLNTNWSQEFPFNMYTKFVKDNNNRYVQAPTGCTPITISQYLYWHHCQHGTPVYMVDTATYNESSMDYSFSGNSATVWNLYYNNDNSIEDLLDDVLMSPTAIFIAYVGQKLETRYNYDNSSTTLGSETGTLKFFLNENYSYSTNSSGENLMTILSAGYPVICVTTSGRFTYIDKYNVTQTTGFSHSYLIDYLENHWSNIDEYWAYVQINGGDDTEDNSDEDDETSLEELRAKYGELDIRHIYRNSFYVKMNWGWGGSENDILVNYRLSTLNFSSNKKTLENGSKPIIFYPSTITF